MCLGNIQKAILNFQTAIGRVRVTMVGSSYDGGFELQWCVRVVTELSNSHTFTMATTH